MPLPIRQLSPRFHVLLSKCGFTCLHREIVMLDMDEIASTLHSASQTLEQASDLLLNALLQIDQGEVGNAVAHMKEALALKNSAEGATRELMMRLQG
ncbi:MAG: hypothetical protein RBR52_08790 [Thiomonas sp.]|uniref:hypothetical protein n=1 Tax=Thiomonas sp. TaxID=2047785 RepID=UPI002A36963A|nr:hypothetical protein [Thiomonas sp.]MDY0330576.1 hypothetical protein [Thiomonas sp.]